MTITYDMIRDKALEVGYDDVGITASTIPNDDITAYLDWLKEGGHANLTYMENTMRTDPQQLLPGAKSAIMFISYYKQPKLPFVPGQGLIASYARGRDYHNVHKRRLKRFIRWLEELSGQQDVARGFSDSKPILEKALAVQAGLGWFGKNTLLIHRKFGTFTLLSGLLTTLELPKSVLHLREARCGSCQKCIDACPTGALHAPYKLDAARCLSYHTIESKLPIPDEIAARNPGYIFGCDICQDACPHNQRKPDSQTTDFQPNKLIGPYVSEKELAFIQEDEARLFGSPLNRRGSLGLQYNLTRQRAIDKQTSSR